MTNIDSIAQQIVNILKLKNTILNTLILDRYKVLKIMFTCSFVHLWVGSSIYRSLNKLDLAFFNLSKRFNKCILDVSNSSTFA